MKQLMYFYPHIKWDHFNFRTGRNDVRKLNCRVRDRDSWWEKDAPKMEKMRRRKDAERARTLERGAKLRNGTRLSASVWDLLYISKGQVTGLMPGCKDVDREKVKKKAASEKASARKQGKPKGCGGRKRKSSGDAEAKKPKRASKAAKVNEGKVARKDGGASVNDKTSDASKESAVFVKKTGVVKKIIAAKQKMCVAVKKSAVKKCRATTSSKEKNSCKGNGVCKNKKFPKSKKVTTQEKSATGSIEEASAAEIECQTKKNIESVKSAGSETRGKDQSAKRDETEPPQEPARWRPQPQNADGFYSTRTPELVFTAMPGHQAVLDRTNEAAERNPRDWITDRDPDVEPVHGGSLFSNMKKSIGADVSYRCARDKHGELCRFARLLDPSKDPRWKFVWLKDRLATPGERSQRRKFFQMFSRKHMEVEKYAVATS